MVLAYICYNVTTLRMPFLASYSFSSDRQSMCVQSFELHMLGQTAPRLSITRHVKPLGDEWNAGMCNVR